MYERRKRVRLYGKAKKLFEKGSVANTCSIVQREVGHVIHEGREERKGSDMLICALVALGGTACRMPVFQSRKIPHWHRWFRLFAPFAPFVDQPGCVPARIIRRG